MTVKVYFEVGLQNAVDLSVNPGEHLIEVDLDQWNDVERKHLKTLLKSSERSKFSLGVIAISKLSAEGLREAVNSSLAECVAHEREIAAQRAEFALKEIEKKKEVEYIYNVLKNIPIEDFPAYVEVPEDFKHYKRGSYSCQFAGREAERCEHRKRLADAELKLLNELRAPYLERIDPVLVRRVEDGYGDEKEISEAIYNLIFAESKYASYPPQDYEYKTICTKLSNAEYVKLSEIKAEMPDKHILKVRVGNRRIDGILKREVYAWITWNDVGYKFVAEVPISIKAIEESADDDDADDDSEDDEL